MPDTQRENAKTLFERCGEFAADNLRALMGSDFEKLIADRAAVVRVLVDLSDRRVTVSVKWPARYGDQTIFPCSFAIPSEVTRGV